MNNPTGTVTERVAAGAEWLDTIRPGWAGEVDLETLEFPSTTDCVLGQLYGDYGDALIELGLRGSSAGLKQQRRHGFHASNWEDADNEYGLLTAEWKRLIGARRNGGAS